ncbi:uncharacterized protein DS421_6g191610 [Arachis hypogaea]|nr:uncharacterized protein DS421_6g191610 [Arachis hypogaea]
MSRRDSKRCNPSPPLLTSISICFAPKRIVSFKLCPKHLTQHLNDAINLRQRWKTNKTEEVSVLNTEVIVSWSNIDSGGSHRHGYK